VQLLGGNVAGVAAAAVDDVAVAVVTANFQLTQSGKWRGRQRCQAHLARNQTEWFEAQNLNCFASRRVGFTKVWCCYFRLCPIATHTKHLHSSQH